MSQSHSDPAHSPNPSHSNVALIVSVCVNLLLAGIIAMAAFKFMTHRPEPPAPVQVEPAPAVERSRVRQVLAPRALMRAVPGKADAIHGVIDRHRDRLDVLRAAMYGARRDVLQAFAAPDLDQGAFEKALVRMQAADAAFETEVLKVAVEARLLLTPEERKRAAEMRPFGRGFHGGRHHGGRHGWWHGRGGARDGAPGEAADGPQPLPDGKPGHP